MALSLELIRRLEGDEPLAKRLKLAENAYRSTDVSTNRKEEKILKWLFKTAPTDYVAYNTLKMCLDCHGTNSRSNLLHQERILVVDNLISLLKVTEDDNALDSIFDFCESLFSLSGMQQFFQNKINKFGLLLKHIFVRIKTENNNNNNNNNDNETGDTSKISIQATKVRNCVLSGLDCLAKIQKQNIDKDKLAETFIDYILFPLCKLVDPSCKDNTNTIGAETHKCMQKILFPRTRLPEYREYFETRDERAGSLPNKLFKTIAKQEKLIGDCKIGSIIDFIFHAAVGSYKTDSSLVDNLFREFIKYSGNSKTIILNSLIKHLADVPLDYENKIDDTSLTDFLLSLIEQTLNAQNFSEEEYNLLRNITELNPLVVENKLPKIFERILLENRNNDSEKESYVLLTIAILNASSKLRREQKLIPWILLALHEALRDNKECNLSTVQILPTEFTAKFIEFASRLNSSQVIAILKSLTFHFKSNCVEDYGKGSKNHVSLMAECTVSLFVSFSHGIVIFEHTVPLLMQQKFVVALGQLGEVLSALVEKILQTEHDERMTIVLFEATLSWSKIHSILNYYVPNSEAGNLGFPISENNFKHLIQRVKHQGQLSCRNALNRLSFDRASVHLDGHKPREKLNCITGDLADCWKIIIDDYPELIKLLDVDQLSEFTSLILEDIILNGLENFREMFDQDIRSESKEFVVAVLCNCLIRIGSVMGNGTSATIAGRINLTTILRDITNDAAVPALKRKTLIRDITRLSDLSKDGSSTIERCLETLLCVPLMFLSIPLRTMVFVLIYVVGKECDCSERIRELCEKISFETLEEGGLNVFEYMEPTSLMEDLPGNELLQKVFKMSFRNAEPFVSLERLSTGVDNCPEEAAPAVLSCIDKLKPKLNNEERARLAKVEKKLGKKVLGEAERNLKSAGRTKSLIVALKIAIRRNKVEKSLKKSVKSTLRSTFEDDDDDKAEDKGIENSNGKDELIKEGFELALIALQHRARFELSEELVSDIWAMVLKHPETRIVNPLLETSVPHVFNEVLTKLYNRTVLELQETGIARLNKTLEIWDSVFNSDMGGAKNKHRLHGLHKLLQSLQMVDVHADNWPDMIKLLLTIVRANHMELSGENTDLIISTASRSLRKSAFKVCDQVLTLCVNLLRFRTEIITDRLPILLGLYKESISLITREAKRKNTEDEHRLALCALNIEKVTGALIKLKRDMKRLSPYLLADLIKDLAEEDLPNSVKESYRNCFNNLCSICDSHGLSFLSRTLPADKRTIFKRLYETYDKFHRFTGKI